VEEPSNQPGDSEYGRGERESDIDMDDILKKIIAQRILDEIKGYRPAEEDTQNPLKNLSERLNAFLKQRPKDGKAALNTFVRFRLIGNAIHMNTIGEIWLEKEIKHEPGIDNIEPDRKLNDSQLSELLRQHVSNRYAQMVKEAIDHVQSKSK
jgi:hypothetical protein